MSNTGHIGMCKKLLPPAVAVWAMLNDAENFVPQTMKRGTALDAWGRYTLHLKFDGEHHDEVETWLADCLNTFGLPRGRLPWRPDGTSGSLLIATSSQRPGAIDAAKNVIPPTMKVGQGSKLKAYVTAQSFIAFGGGISLHLNSYQVLELNGGYEDPFNVETGYLLPESTNPMPQWPAFELVSG
jgi:hypothetical protein